MTDIRVSEWDGTPWAGSQPSVLKALSPVRRLDEVKVVNGGAAANAWANDVPLSMWADDPLARAAAYLRAYKVGWFYKAESKISLDIANLKRTLAPEDNAGDNETDILEADLSTPWERLDPPHQFLRLMERPNPYQTGRQLFQKTEIRIDMAGWAWWYMEGAGPVGSGVLPSAIYGISPSRLTPSYARDGTLLGYALDVNNPSGPTATFQPYEIVPFNNETAEDDRYGQGVVEAVLAELPLGRQFAQHQADLLATGGRLAGMLWPKERTLDEAEFLDAQRAWRSVASDPNAARRLLLFPEPMEYATGAADPAAIGIPDLSVLNRDNILTAFPISPYMLGVPTPGGLNSGEVRKQERREYWEGTIHPRVELLEEVVQTKVVALYEAVTGVSYDFDIEEPNLDDATSLIEKVAAFDALTTAGFKATDVIEMLGLDGMEWTPPPPPIVPTVNAPNANPTVAVPVEEQAPPTKAQKSVVEERDKVTDKATRNAHANLTRFFRDQRDRTIAKIRHGYPKSIEQLPTGKRDAAKRALQDVETKALRDAFVKAQPSWWDAEAEDAELEKVMRTIYTEVGRGGLQAVADTLGRFIFKGATNAVIADLLEVGGERIKDINARTLQALTVELAEGTRRGYSIPQLIEGVPAEGFRGVAQAGLDNGVEVWSDNRAETIARTETMLSYNRATVTGYGEFGVKYLLAYDGVDDHECEVRNGEEYSIEDALAEEDHPNGTLVWSPVVDKAVDITSLDRTGEWLEAIKSIAAPQPVNITNHLPGVTVSPPDVFVTNQPPDVHVAPPNVTVEAPSITIEPAAPFAEVLDAVNDKLTELSKPKRILRNAQGRITGVETE